MTLKLTTPAAVAAALAGMLATAESVAKLRNCRWLIAGRLIF